MREVDVNNQMVSVNVVHGSVNSAMIILMVTTFMSFILALAWRYSLSRFKARRKYRNRTYNRMRVGLNIALGAFLSLTFILGAISLVMGSANDDKTLAAFNTQVKHQTGYDVVFLDKELNQYFVRESRNSDNIGKTYHNVILSKNNRAINCRMRNITTGANANTLRYFFNCGSK